jgi:TrmH family RNA methyltransferase
MPLSRNKIKLYRSLRQSKGRKESGLFLVEGPLLVQEALREGWELQEVLLSQEYAQSSEGRKITRLLDISEIPFVYGSASDLTRVSDAETSQGIIGIAKLPEMRDSFPQPVPDDVILVLERVSDPGNLGTILRTADWFGIRYVILGSGSVDPFNPKVVRGTAGSIFRVKIQSPDDLGNFLEKEAGRRFYAAALQGKLLPHDLPTQGRRGLILGHEKLGVSAEIIDRCAASVLIPGSGRAESLNLAVAAGILLYMIQRRGF